MGFITNARQKVAKLIDPIPEPKLLAYGNTEFAIHFPKIKNEYFTFHNSNISPDLALADSGFIPKDIYTLSKPASIIEFNTLINGISEAQPFIIPFLLETSTDYYSEVAITIPQISDFSNTYSIQKESTTIISISFRLEQPTIKGKNYNKPTNIAQPSLFSEHESEGIQNPNFPNKSNSRTNNKKHYSDTFDIFDLIFPTLQTPLGTALNNPISFPFPLYPFQIEGVQFLYKSKHALLGDEMGLGKSIQTITAARILFREGQINSCLIVCPKAVITDWENKFWDWAPELKVIKIIGDKDARKLLWHQQTHVYICTYETLLRDLEKSINTKNLEIKEDGHSIICPNNECRKRFTISYNQHYKNNQCPHCTYQFIYPKSPDIAKTFFDLVVLDEIQKTKNKTTGQTKAVRSIYANYKWGLTGTPLENSIEDLITICNTIKPGIFINVNTYDNKAVVNAYKPIFKRRKKEDVLTDLPPKITKEVWLELSPSQRVKYNKAETEGIFELKDKGQRITLQHVLALITKLKQICNYDEETNESSKLEYLKEELEELTEQGDKALVFSQFPNSTLKQIIHNLKEYHPAIYDGSLSDNQRNIIINDFQNSDECKVLLISLRAGNSGITLTRANYVYHFDLWWNPAITAQAADRAHRIGQQKTVFERLLLIENSIERRIYDLLTQKKLLFNEIVDNLSDTNVLTNTLTENEIFSLFGLNKVKPIELETSNKIKIESKSLNPFEFEQYIGALFQKMGYNVKVTQKSNDGGVDIYAKLNTPTGTSEIIIQCKHKLDPNSSVEVSKVRELFGVLASNKKLNSAILVTNGTFTKKAIEFAKSNNIELIDGIKLQSLVSRYL